MVKKLWLAIVISVLALTTLASEQDEEWKVLLFAGDKILTVNADGFDESIALPEPAQNINQGLTYYNVALSPNEQYFVFVDEEQSNNNYTATLIVVDLTANDCCREIPAPDGETWEVMNLLGFSPDSRYIAINFLNAYTNDFASLLAILDLETGEYTTSFDPMTTDINSNAVFFLDWTEDGIEIVPTCFPCGASADGATMLWKPETNELTRDYGFNIAFGGSTLPNGETIEAIQHPDYPISDADSMFDPANVIEYFQIDDRENSEIIYFNPRNINLLKPEWVIDGQAYIIQYPFGEAVTLVWRDGRTETFQFEAPRMFLTGTPDGWLMTNQMGDQLERFIWNGNSFEQHGFVNDKPMKLLSTVELGETTTDKMVSIIGQ